LVATVIVLVSVVVSDLIIISYINNGLGYTQTNLWDWLGLLIIPVAITLAGIWLSNVQVRREVTASNEHAQDEALQKYLDQMSDLLVDKQLRECAEDSDIRMLAQAHTLATMLKLDRSRKRHPLKLIAQLKLINRDKPLLHLKNAGLDTADLHEVTLLDVSLKEADLRLADLTGANLKGSDLTWADLRGTDLRRAVLINACLASANLLPYDRRNPGELSAPHLLNGSDPSDVDRSKRLTPARLNDINLTPTRLESANLQRADLRDAFLYRANLTGVDLTNTILTGADLRCANLQGANLSGADLTDAFLYRANLTGVDLTDAILTGADLRCANLQGANLSGAGLRGADLSDAKLGSAKLNGSNLGIYTRQDKNTQQIVEVATTLYRTDLRRADLTGAVEYNGQGQERQITVRWLKEKTGLLAGAMMPDGTRYRRSR